MNKDEIIEYIRTADPFYRKIDLSGQTPEQLRKLMELLMAGKQFTKEERNDKGNNIREEKTREDRENREER
jgi:hypothetical protein